MDLKQPLSFEDQINKLKAHGLIIDKKKIEEYKKVLGRINYYRFTGYGLQFRVDANDSNYVKGTAFEQILNIYQFDEELRQVLRKYIEIAEVYYRTQIAYNFALSKCTEPPYTQHYDESNYYNKNGFHEVMNTLKREKNYYKDSLIVKHHKAKYSSKMPLWVIVEIMSFSNISKLYNAMYYSEKDLIALSVGAGRKILENNLHCLAVLRNKCAHAARLYNTEFNPPATIPAGILRKNPDVKTNTLFAYVIVLLRRLPDDKSKSQFVADITNLIIRYDKKINLKFIGFPENYEEILKRYESA